MKKLDHETLGRIIRTLVSKYDNLKAQYELVNVLNKISNAVTKDSITVATLRDGTVCRYLDGKLHCDDDYAVVTPDGSKCSFVNGEYQSIEVGDKVLPSVVWNARSEQYIAYHNKGLFNSYNDVPAIGTDCINIWFSDGIISRMSDKPTSYDSPGAAIEHPEFKAWFNLGVEIAVFTKPKVLYTQEEVDELIKDALVKERKRLLDGIVKLMI